MKRNAHTQKRSRVHRNLYLFSIVNNWLKVGVSSPFQPCSEASAAFSGCPCISRDFWNRAPAVSLKSQMSYKRMNSSLRIHQKWATYPLCRRLTMSKFSLAILSSSLFLTPSFRLLGFMLIDRLVTCWVVGTEARFPWDISSKFLINMALFLLIWFSRSEFKVVENHYYTYLEPETFLRVSWAG